MNNGFTQLKVCDRTVALLKKSGINNPMPVQERAIPALYAKKDVIARAQTGTGKTLAFVIPMMEKIDIEKEYVQALIIAPTRELAVQITNEITKLTADTGIKTLTVVGGRDFETQKNKLKNKVHIMVGTPGRLLDHIRKGNVALRGVEYLVLDEVDEMLEQGFGDEALEIIGMTNEKRQTMLCSATLDEEVRKLGQKITRNTMLIDIEPNKTTVDKIEQICIKVSEEKKEETLEILIKKYNPYLMIVFCYSKERAIELFEKLDEKRYNVDVLHGDMSQAKRKTVMKSFRDAKLQILVASDIAARGLDVEGVTHVINYDIPHDGDWYVHRIGRTGRAGNEGMAITFYTAEDTRWLNNIENKLNVKLERQNIDGDVVSRTKKRFKKEVSITATRKKTPMTKDKATKSSKIMKKFYKSKASKGTKKTKLK